MAVATVREQAALVADHPRVGIGVVTLTFMVSIIQGLQQAFAEQIESLARTPSSSRSSTRASDGRRTTRRFTARTSLSRTPRPSARRPPTPSTPSRPSAKDRRRLRHAGQGDRPAHPLRRHARVRVHALAVRRARPLRLGGRPHRPRERRRYWAQDVVRPSSPTKTPWQGDQDRGDALPRRRRDGDFGDFFGQSRDNSSSSRSRPSTSTGATWRPP